MSITRPSALPWKPSTPISISFSSGMTPQQEIKERLEDRSENVGFVILQVLHLYCFIGGCFEAEFENSLGCVFNTVIVLAKEFCRIVPAI